MFDLKNDEEFCSLKYPINKESYDKLEENIFENGCLSPILVWDDIIIDGRKRYEICKKWELPFNVRRIHFENRYGAISWICKNQLQRKDIPEETRKYLIGKYYEAAKEGYTFSHDLSDTASRSRGFQYKLAGEIGQEVQLATSTIYKYGICTRAIDTIASKNKNIARKILSGAFRISQSNVIEISRLSEEELRTLNSRLTGINMEHVTYAEIRQELNWQHYSLSSSGTDSDDADIQIKKVPAYDPDAEISSLALTIPSWISSIKRAETLADFDKTTLPARQNLLQELFALHKAVFAIQKSLEEVEP